MSKFRRLWAFIAFNLAVAGLVTESVTHLCACVLFNPFASPFTVAALAGTAACLLSNEAALASVGPNSGQDRGLALVATGAALPVAFAVAAAFVVVLPASFFLLACFGLGVLVWMPYLVCAVFFAQIRALWHSLSETPGRRLYLALGIAAALCMTGTLFSLWNAGMLHVTYRSLG